VIGIIVSTLIVLLFVCTAVNAFVEAHCVTASNEWTAPLLSQLNF
jgi:hypothetical protein